MRLTIVGCAGSFPRPDSAASCYLLEHEGSRILLDLGSGALGPLQSHTELRDLDGVLLSHLHPDHFADMCGLFVTRRYSPGPPMSKIPVCGPSDVALRLAQPTAPSRRSGWRRFSTSTHYQPRLHRRRFTVPRRGSITRWRSTRCG
jgi:ribonuclease BN (tRNA processing enzyme)